MDTRTRLNECREPEKWDMKLADMSEQRKGISEWLN